jgi:2-phospho-L-lactate guanylyltransferase
VAQNWTAVIPVKRLHAAKTRLRGAVPAARHEELALALVRDTAAAVLACPEVAEVLVVTDDPAAADAARALGARVVPEDGATDLNAALRRADRFTRPGRDRAVLTGDLPALRPEDLSDALRRVGARAFVPDAAGTGTVLLAAAAGVALDPRFGVDSGAAHAASGADRITGDWPGLRRDVDTVADLRAVLALGTGPHTCAVLRAAGLAGDCRSAA